MKIVQELECRSFVQVSLSEDGELAAKVTVEAPYAPGRTCKTSRRIEDVAQLSAVHEALKHLLTTIVPEMLPEVLQGVLQTQIAAKKSGEL